MSLPKRCRIEPENTGVAPPGIVASGHVGDEYYCEEVASNDVIKFKVVDNTGKVLHVFSPEFTHQLFEDEVIYGYSDLDISVYLTPALDCHVNISFRGTNSCLSRRSFILCVHDVFIHLLWCAAQPVKLLL